jgi:hypothetical protein
VPEERRIRKLSRARRSPRGILRGFASNSVSSCMFSGERASLKADNGSAEPPSILGFQFLTERQQRTSQFHIAESSDGKLSQMRNGVTPPDGRTHMTDPVDTAIILMNTMRRSVQALGPNAISGRKL